VLEHLELTLLGDVHITCGGKPISGFKSAKAQALVCYLAVSGRPHSREELAHLLWGEMPESDAKANLRVTLCNLRTIIGPYIAVDRRNVMLQPLSSRRLDVARFRAILQHIDDDVTDEHLPALREAVALYRGELLHNVYVRNAAAFEEWLRMEREQLRQLAVRAFYLIAMGHAQRGEFAEGVRVATQLLEIEPWNEEAHRLLILLFVRSGRRSAALMQYERCCRALATELGVEPARETIRLYERVRYGNADSAMPSTRDGGRCSVCLNAWK
jgi:DNA-binding SARP family transcriptional activator